jgi:hypothetical protein
MGRPFQVRKLRLPLAQAIAANMTATVKIYTDNGSTSTTIATINNTNFSGKKCIAIYPQVNGENDFFVEIRFTGTALLTVALPITGIIETKED